MKFLSRLSKDYAAPFASEKLLGCWVVGLLGCWVVGVLGCWVVGLLAC